MTCFNHKYLNNEHLSGFEHYKYSSLDTSPLSIYVMHPFWNYIVQYFPTWIAPNLLTFVGFLLTFTNFALFSFYDYNFYASSDLNTGIVPIPKWVFIVAAINIFVAYTLDGIDGKQARRTQTSGPLGELFDHGLDSYSTVLIPGALFSVFGRAGAYSISVVRMYYVCWNVFLNFHLSHWEKYNTGVLFLPWGYDFSMWGSTLFFLLTGFFGHEVWKFRVFGISSGVFFEILLYLSSIVSNLPVIIFNIYMSYKNKTGKMLNFTEAMRPLVPVTYFLFLGTFWVYYSPSNIVERDPRALFFFTGTVFSNICCHLIISQMTNTRAEVFNWLLLPSTAVTLTSVFLLQSWPSAELGLLYALCALATWSHIHYGTCVVRQMCEHFKIRCFKIRPHGD